MSTFRTGDVTVTLDDTFERLAKTATERIEHQVAQLVEGQTQEILRSARSIWPRRTGATAAAMRAEVKVGQEHIQASLENDIRDETGQPMAARQHWALRPRVGVSTPPPGMAGKSPWTELVEKPLLEAAHQVVEQAPVIMKKALEG